MITGGRLRAWGALVLTTLLLPSCTGGAGPATACRGGWHVLMGPAGARESNELFGVSVASPADAWAVGVALPSPGAARTLVERWQGAEWRTVPSPDRSSGGSFLNAVVALSASDAWAVGLSRSPGGPARTLILHWDGRRWAITASPNAGSGGNALVSVAAVSARDVWAVGYRDAGTVYRSLVEHWDGDRWTVVRLPLPGGPGDGLNAVDVAASGVVWAVGGSARARGPSQPLVLRLDGQSWSPVRAPASLHSATLSGVAALGGKRAWIVGAARSGAGDRAFGLQADGRNWHVVPIDFATALSVDLNAIWAATPDEVWAVGSSFDGRWYRPLVEHGLGGRWSSIPTPDIRGYDARLMAVAGIAGGGLWAVGSASRSAGPQRVLILHRCATQASRQPEAITRRRPASARGQRWSPRRAPESLRPADERSRPFLAARAGLRRDSASTPAGSRHARGAR